MQITTGQKISCASATLLLLFVTTAHSAVGNMMVVRANLLNCSSAGITAQPTAKTSKPAAIRMIASWYGKEFQGRKTSSGEAFDLNKLTAAHKTLPIGSLVKLTAPITGRSVIVRINDRGPWLKGRDLDISEAAAIKLGIHEKGFAPVEMALLK